MLFYYIDQNIMHWNHCDMNSKLLHSTSISDSIYGEIRQIYTMSGSKGNTLQCTTNPGIDPAYHTLDLHVQVALMGYCTVKGEGNCLSIGSTVSEAIIGTWQWSTATGSSQWGRFSSITASS